MDGCIFCAIVKGEQTVDVLFENDDVIAFKDIHPVAPVHVLVIPKEHIASFRDLRDDQVELAGSLFIAAKKVAEIEGEQEGGYRLAVVGKDVPHLHLHVIGGPSKKSLEEL